jgi:hypothetical protein
MTIERIKELLEIAEGVNYFGTYYDISTYDKSKSEVRMHVTGEDYIVSVDELAEDADIAFYRCEKIE